MAAGSLFLTLGITLSLLTQVEGSPSVFVVTPNIFIANEWETVSVLVLHGDQRPAVRVRIYSHGQKHYSSRRIVTKGIQHRFSLRVDAARLGTPHSDGQHYVWLHVQCGYFYRATYILVKKRTGTVFLQTDKPLYSPGQTVFMRVFTLDQDRNGTQLPIRLEITDPNEVIIYRRSSSTDSGLKWDEFQIPKRPVFGIWKIAVYYGSDFSESRERLIEVAKYVLPHFYVRMKEYPEYIASRNETVEGKVEARYAFNAAVVGKVRVKFSVVTDGRAEYLTHQTIPLHDGTARFTLSGADKDTLDMRQLLDSKSHLQIEAIVTETSTGISEKAVAPRCHFVTSPYIIRFEQSAPYFSLGLDLIIRLTVHHLSGSPAPKRNITLRVIASGIGITELKMTDNQGRVKFRVNVHALRTISVLAKVKGYDASETRKVFSRANMQEYIKINRGNYPLKPGQKSDIEVVFTNSNNDQFYYMVVSGGRIVEVGNKTKEAGNIGVTFKPSISFNYVPSFRFVVWYFTRDGGQLVSASTTFQVERKCKTEAVVRVVGAHFAPLPGKEVNIEFSGTIGAKIAAMAVDKSVYFLDNSSRLTRKKFFDEFESNDLGCAVEGGADAFDVFKMAGLAVLSNNYTHSPRRSTRCNNNHVASRQKRSTPQICEEKSACCNKGNNTGYNVTESTSQRQHKMCLTHAKQYTHRTCMDCINAFGECCVRTARTQAKSRSGHARTAGNRDVEEDEFSLITIESQPERVDFRDSWMLQSWTIPKEGSLRKEKTLPDSITTWVFQAVTISTTEGMCVAEPFEQVVRKEVFLKLHLPQTAVLGEQLELAATVYNLQQYDLPQLKVKFLSPEGLCTDVIAGEYSEHSYFGLKKRSSWTAHWPIVPIKSGMIKITVKLYTSGPSDIATQVLTVVPSGELVVAPMLQITQDPSGRQSSSQQYWNGTTGSLKYNGTRDTRRRVQTTNLELKVPQDAVSDTAVMTVSLLGDIMTPMVDSFVHGAERHLIRPSGCGSQTLAKLGPLVFAARYLQEHGKLTAEYRSKAREHMSKGIYHMKTYQKSDGGFAVHNNRHSRSTVWLTAFAVRTFTYARASELINVDNRVIGDASAWLMTQRDRDTGFFSGNTIHFKTGNTLGTTAYIYIALLDSGYYTEHNREVRQTLDRLSERAARENDPYVLAIVTYALARYDHPERFSINRRLLSLATNLTDSQPMLTYWGSGNVETAGYALLAQVALGRIVESTPIVEWLVRQRYGGSYFETTQSTVVALQALVEYSHHADRLNRLGRLNMTCTLSFPTIPNRRIYTFTLNEANKLVQQRKEVTDHIGLTLSMVCKGTGVIHTAVETSYYSTKSQAENCAFNITAQAIPKDRKRVTIEVCSSVKEVYHNLSMPMLEVGIGTGFTPDIPSLDKLQTENIIDLYEVNDRAVVLYVKEIPSDRELCLTFDVNQEPDHEVKQIRPVPVKVYAYYEPDKTSCRTFYHPLGNSTGMLDVRCDSTRRWCKCLENECPPCYGYHSLDRSAAVPLPNDTVLKSHACKKQYINYVFAGTIEEKVNRNGEVRYTMVIDTVAKPGTEARHDVENNRRVFSYPTKCLACPLDTRRRYLIMGEDGHKKDGVMEYIISHNTYIMPLYGKAKYDPDKRKLNRTERSVNNQHKRFLNNLKNATCGT